MGKGNGRDAAPGGRNPYAAAHSMRGAAGAGAHRDARRREIDRLEADLVDPYGPEWMEACDRPSGGDTGVTREEPLSRQWLADRGACCGCGCTHCPYIPRHSRDETNTGGEDDI